MRALRQLAADMRDNNFQPRAIVAVGDIISVRKRRLAAGMATDKASP